MDKVEFANNVYQTENENIEKINRAKEFIKKIGIDLSKILFVEMPTFFYDADTKSMCHYSGSPKQVETYKLDLLSGQENIIIIKKFFEDLLEGKDKLAIYIAPTIMILPSQLFTSFAPDSNFEGMFQLNQQAPMIDDNFNVITEGKVSLKIRCVSF